MNIPIFLSYPKPCFDKQQKFIDKMVMCLRERGLEPRTLGVTDYDMEAPLKGIRRLLLESNGLLTVAFRRTYIANGTMRYRTDIESLAETTLKDCWMTTPWSHIEAAMGFQLGLPILILREKGVIEDGILEKGIVGLYMPELNTEKAVEDYFKSSEWISILGAWECNVRSVVSHKGNPPQLY